MIPSDAPSESIRITCGRCASRPRLVSGLHVTPDDVIARRPERSQRSGSASSAASSGRGERVADDRAHLHVLALDRVPHRVGVEARRVEQHDRAAAGERRQRDEQIRCRASAGTRAGTVAARLSARIAASTSGGCGAGPRHLPQRHVEVVGAPHHGLRAAGRAAGVEEHEVVARRLAIGRRLRRRGRDRESS